MEKTSSIIQKLCVLFIALMILTACSSGGNEVEATTEILPTESVAVTEFTEPTGMTASQPEEIPFSDYEYLYTEERNRAWEEDVVFLAKAFLGEYPMKGHPLLVNKDVSAWKTGDIIDFQSFYQEDMRDTFVEDLESLIRDIPVLTDTEIVYEMQRIVANLSDLHSYLNLPSSDIFVIMAEPFYSDEGMELRVVRLPVAYQDALFGELVAINGVPVDEVVERLSQYISYEWEYGKMFNLTSALSMNMINKKDALGVAGIVGTEDTAAEFEIITEQGEHVVLEIQAVAPEAYKSIEKVYGDWNHAKYSYYDGYQDANYYLNYEEANQLLYIRFNREDEMTDYRFFDFIADIKKYTSENSCKKIVVDFRTNSGGRGLKLHEDLIKVLDQSAAEQIYVLIDAASYSDAILLPMELQQNLSNVVILGIPGGQSPNFFASPAFYNLPNSGHMFAVSTGYFLGWPNYEYETLMPDITVYQTLEDYKQGIDTVLEYVRNIDQ